MPEPITNPEVEPQNPVTPKVEPEGDDAVITLEALMKEVKSLRKEAAGYRVKNKETQEQLTAAQEALKTKDEALTTLTTAIKVEKVTSEFEKAAKAAGVIDTKAAMKLTNIDSIIVKDDNSVDTDSVKATIEALKTEYPVLFKEPKQKIDASEKGSNDKQNINDWLRSQ